MVMRAVVFDCDGVLADSEPAWAAAEVVLCRRYGVDRSSRPTTRGLSLLETVRVLIPGLSPADALVAERRLADIAAESVPGSVRALPGAVELVTRLSAVVPVGVASNSPRSVLGEVLRAIGVLDMITIHTAFDDVRRPKPAPDVYLRTCADLMVEPAATIALEDSITGIRAARAAGCTVLQVAVEGVPRYDDADGHLESLVSAADAFPALTGA